MTQEQKLDRTVGGMNIYFLTDSIKKTITHEIKNGDITKYDDIIDYIQNEVYNSSIYTIDMIDLKDSLTDDDFKNAYYCVDEESITQVEDYKWGTDLDIDYILSFETCVQFVKSQIGNDLEKLLEEI